MNNIKEKIVKHAQEANNSWCGAYDLFSRRINENNLKVGVEVGVAFGGHSEALLKNTKIEKLYGVDPYKHMIDYDDPMNLPQEEFDEVYSFTLNRLAVFGDRYTHIRKISNLAIADIPGKLDFVYIDADHSYEGVLNDLKAWFVLVNDGGLIGGHDYDHPGFPGVKIAVDEFFRRFGWTIHTEGEGVWWVKKEPIKISFIMPAYNCAGTVGESIDSIMDGNFEKGDQIVIVNDCSTDNTVVILDEIKKRYRDQDIAIVSHDFNKGGAAARNTAVEHSRNELIFCLDSDNVLAQGSIPKLKKFMIETGSDIVSFGELHYFEKDKNQITGKWIFQDGVVTLADIFSNIVVPGASGNYLYTKESWMRAGRYPEFAGALDAWGFGFRQVATGSIMLAMPNSFYYHRHGHESYWVRDAKQEGKISLAALQIILPFINLINDEDVEYIMGKAGRLKWFDELSSHPLRIVGVDPTAQRGVVKTRSVGIIKRVYRKLGRIISKNQ